MSSQKSHDFCYLALGSLALGLPGQHCRSTMTTTTEITIAERIGRLGSETAFSVSAEANVGAQGRTMYHASFRRFEHHDAGQPDRRGVRAARAGKTGYCSFYGIPELRQALADDVSRSHQIPLTLDNVVIQPGGKPSIGKFILSLMNPGDEVLYPNPGYPIYESQIEFHGGRARPYGFQEGSRNFEIDLDSLTRQIHGADSIAHLRQLANPTRRRIHDRGNAGDRRNRSAA